MRYHDLRDFIAQLEKQGELKRIAVEVSPHLEMTEICDRVLQARRPGDPVREAHGAHASRCWAICSARRRRVAMGMGEESVEALREVGKLLAYLKEPDPPAGLKDAWDKLPVLKKVLDMAPKERRSAPCQEIVWEGADVDLGAAADPDLLAGRCGAADHLGPDGHARPEQAAPEPGHLPPAGDRAATRSSCAGWRIAAARWISATIAWRIPASRSRSPSRSAPIRRRSSAR